jgi:predicted RNase H-like HicB family nuclease
MKTYKVRYELDETGWWVASIDAVPGCHTQGRTIEQARERIREALAALTSDKLAASAKLEDDVQLPKPVRKLVVDLQTKRMIVAEVTADAENAIRDAALALAKSMSLRDVGTVLGVSRQRAHQLVTDPHRKERPVGKALHFFQVGTRPKAKARKPARSHKHAS